MSSLTDHHSSDRHDSSLRTFSVQKDSASGAAGHDKRTVQLFRLREKLVTSAYMPMPICNHFHERLANNGKLTTFTGVARFDALVCRFP